jgi:hypothetical protein
LIRAIGARRACEAQAVEGTGRGCIWGSWTQAARGARDGWRRRAPSPGALASRRRGRLPPRPRRSWPGCACGGREARGGDREIGRLREAEAPLSRAARGAREALSADPDGCGCGPPRLPHPAWPGTPPGRRNSHRQDRDTKGRPYLADPLFRYLWERGFGTAAYRAFGPRLRMPRPARGPRRPRFDAARRDYALLTELPERLAAHAQRMQEAAVAGGYRGGRA